MRAALIFFLLAASAIAQDAKPTTLGIDEYQSLLGEFSRVAVSGVTRRQVDAEPLNKAAAQSTALNGNAIIRAQTLNIIRSLAALGQGAVKAHKDISNIDPENKPLLSPLSGYQWAEQEKERLAKNFVAMSDSTSKYISACLAIMQRQAATPSGKQFAILPSDPMIAAIDSEFQAIKDEVRAYEFKKDHPPVKMETLQVLPTGCLVQVKVGRYDYKTIFAEGLTGPNVAEQQTYELPIMRDGVYQYEATTGASRTVENWKVIFSDR